MKERIAKARTQEKNNMAHLCCIVNIKQQISKAVEVLTAVTAYVTSYAEFFPSVIQRIS